MATAEETKITGWDYAQTVYNVSAKSGLRSGYLDGNNDRRAWTPAKELVVANPHIRPDGGHDGVNYGWGTLQYGNQSTNFGTKNRIVASASTTVGYHNVNFLLPALRQEEYNKLKDDEKKQWMTTEELMAVERVPSSASMNRWKNHGYIQRIESLGFNYVRREDALTGQGYSTPSFNIVVGAYNTLGGKQTTLVGYANNVTASEAVVIGNRNNVSIRSIAIGEKVEAHSLLGTAIGPHALIAADAITDEQYNALSEEEKANYFERTDKYSSDVGFIGGNTSAPGLSYGMRWIRNAPDNTEKHSFGRSNTAIGSSATAIGENTYAFGERAFAWGESAFSIGTISLALGGQTLASGYRAQALGGGSTALGYDAYAGEKGLTKAEYDKLTLEEKRNYNPVASWFGLRYIKHHAEQGSQVIMATAVGAFAQASDSRTLALGVQSKASAVGSTAIGNGAKSSALNSIAQGTVANASASNAIAQGTQAKATNEGAIGIGWGANASGKYATTIGVNSKASAESALSLGTSANASAEYASAMGAGAAASGVSATSLGASTVANGAYAAAVGVGAEATAESGAAVGAIAKATGVNSSAFGKEAVATGASALASGASSVASANSSTALGTSAIANITGAVALGSESVTRTNKGAVGYAPLIEDWDKKTIDQLLIAIDPANEARVKNLPDAMKNAEEAVKNADQAVKDDDGSDPAALTQKKAALAAAQKHLAQLRSEAGKLVNTWQSSLAAVSLGDVTTGKTRQITNLAAGREDTDAVNVAQLKQLAKAGIVFKSDLEQDQGYKPSLGETVHIFGKEDAAIAQGDYATNYTDANIVTSTVTDENGAKKGVKIWMSKNPLVEGVKFGDDATTAKELKPNDDKSKLTFNGKNLAYESDAVSPDSAPVVEHPAVAYTDDAGNKLFAAPDGKYYTGPVTVIDGNAYDAGAYKGDNGNVYPAGTVKVGGKYYAPDQIENGAPKQNAQEATALQPKQGGKDPADVTTSMMNPAGAGKAGKATKLGNVDDGVDPTDAVNVRQLKGAHTRMDAPVSYVDADGNPLTKAADGKYYKTDDVDELGKPKQGAASKTPFGLKGNPAGGSMKLTNIADGDISPTSTDAINGSQLHQALAGQKFSLSAGNSAAADVVAGDQVKFVTNNANLTLESAKAGTVHTVTLGMSDDPTFNTVTAGKGNEAVTIGRGKVNVAGTDYITEAGLSGGNQKITGVAAGTDDTDAVNVSQLKKFVAGEVNKGLTFAADDGKTKNAKLGETIKVAGGKGASTSIKDGTITVDLDADQEFNSVTLGKGKLSGDAAGNVYLGDQIHDNGLVTFKDLTDTVGGVKWTGKVKSEGTGTVKGGDFVVTKDKPLTFVAGDNVALETRGNDLVVGLSKTPNFETVTTTGGFKVENGPALNPTGLDNAGNKIVNVAPGVDDTDAVNVSQLKDAMRVAGDDTKARRAGAMGAALAAMHPIDYDEEHPTMFTAGYGHYEGAHAWSLGVMRYFTRDLLLSAGMSLSGPDKAFNLGATIRFGASPKYEARRVSTHDYALLKKVELLQKDNVAQLEVINKQEQVIADLLKRVEALEGK